LLVAAVALCGSTAAPAAGRDENPFAAYKLRNDLAAASRLKSFGPPGPAIEAVAKPVIAARFANKRFAQLIDDAARASSLDPALVHAVVEVESGYNPAALSPKGAVGLMQLMPATASRYGVPDPASSPEANLRAGTRYLRYLMDLFDHRMDLALAAYNAGENAVLRYGQRIPPFRETQRYVPAVLARYVEWKEPVPAPVLPPAAPARIQYMTGTSLDRDLPGLAAYLAGGQRRPAQH
jgi:soluble lytic murein transglycosylase-like protein